MARLARACQVTWLGGTRTIGSLRGFASIPALVFAAGCSFSVTTEATVSGDATTIDAAVDAMIDTSPDDIDGDGVKNDTDNCPSVTNTAQFDEDGDMAGDECDACPQLPATADHADSDGDKIGNACDPNPNTAGDVLAYWNGFHVASAALPPGFTMIHGSAARWSVSNGYFVFDALGDDWGMPAVDVTIATHKIDSLFEIVATQSGTASAAGVAVDIAANDTELFECQSRTDTSRREIWRRNPAAPDGWSPITGTTVTTPIDTYRLELERAASTLSCANTRQGQVGIELDGTDDSNGHTRAGLFARNVDVRFKYIAVYTSPM